MIMEIAEEAILLFCQVIPQNKLQIVKMKKYTQVILNKVILTNQCPLLNSLNK